MTDPASIECPHCSEELEAGCRFCDQCGGEVESSPEFVEDMDTQVEALSAEEMKPQAVEESPRPTDNDMTPEIGRLDTHLETPLPRRTPSQGPPGGVPATGSNSNDEDSDSDCPHFRLEYDTARFFVQDRLSSFNFRLIPLTEDVKEVRKLTVKLTPGSGKEMSKPVRHRMRHRHETKIHFNYTPVCPGVRVHADVQVSYQFKGRMHVYLSDIHYNCAEKNQPAKAVENLKVEMKLDANYAADQNVRVLENLGRQDGFKLGGDLERLDLTPVWESRPLYAVEGLSAALSVPPIHEHGLPPLTLVSSKGWRMHLLHNKRFIIGRSRQVDIPYRIFDANGDLNRAHSLCISQRHCSVELGMRGPYILDGALGAGSSGGTWLDKNRLSPAGSPLGAESQGAIRFNNSPVDGPMVIRYRVGPLIPSTPRVQWIFLGRQDGFARKEFYLILDGSCHLREVSVDAPSAEIMRDASGFRVRGGELLYPGHQLKTQNALFEVTAYNPLGFSR